MIYDHEAKDQPALESLRNSVDFIGSKFDQKNDFEEMGTIASHKRAQTSGNQNLPSITASLNSSFRGVNKIPLVKDNQNLSRN